MATLGAPAGTTPFSTGITYDDNSKLEDQLELIKKHKIFVGGIRSHSHSTGIRKLFSRFGEVVEVEFPPNYGNAPGCNFCFVVFRDPNVAAQLVQQKEVFFGKLRVDVRPYKVKKEFQEVDAKNVQHLLESLDRMSAAAMPQPGVKEARSVLENPDHLQQTRNQEFCNLERQLEDAKSSMKFIRSACDALDLNLKKERDQHENDLTILRFNQELMSTTKPACREQIENALCDITTEFLSDIPFEQVRQLSTQLGFATNRVREFILEEEEKQKEKSTCPLCSQEQRKEIAMVPCGHLVCKNCFTTLAVTKKCPTCYAVIETFVKLSR